MRRPRPSVAAQRHRHLRDAHALERGLDHHLARELHSGRAQAQPVVGVLAESAHAAVHVADGGVEQHAPDQRERRVSDPPVRPDHRAFTDASGEPVAHDEIAALAERLEEGSDRREVVAVVGVAHDHVASACGGDASDQGASVALALHVHDLHTELARDRLRTVGAAVVGDDDLRLHAELLDRAARLADAAREGLDLVEAWHHDRQLHSSRLRGRPLDSRSLGDAHG